MPLLCSRVAAALLITMTAAAKDPEWVRLTTPAFDLFTSAGEKKGREAITYFEQVHDLFRRLSNAGGSNRDRVRIIAFRNEKEFAPYRPNEVADAFYLGDSVRDYIVMSSITKQHYPVAVHEYAHLIVKHSGLKLPLWLNEGFAEVYSTLEPIGDKLRIGNVIPGRAHTLSSSRWLPVGLLLNVNHDSPEYNEKNRAGNFYSQSWLLTHMLYLGREYSPKFGQFVRALQSANSAEAFASVYGKTVEAVESDLRAYFKSERVTVGLFDAKLEKPSEAATAAPAEAVTLGLALADLHTLLQHTEAAKAAYGELANRNPENPEVEEALGAFYWRNRDNDAAIEHYRRAAKLGSKNASVMWDYARLLGNKPEHRTEMIDALRTALQLEPGNVEARLQLAFTYFHTERYGETVAALTLIKRVSPDQAPRYFGMLAWSYLKLGDKARARTNIEQSKKFAKDPVDVQNADSILRHLDFEEKKTAMIAAAQSTAASAVQPPELEPPSVPAPGEPGISSGEDLFAMAGVFRHLECRGESARLRLEVGSRNVHFIIEDPERIRLLNAGTDSIELTCGPQKGRRVVIRYARPEPPTLGITGTVRVLEFVN